MLLERRISSFSGGMYDSIKTNLVIEKPKQFFQHAIGIYKVGLHLLSSKSTIYKSWKLVHLFKSGACVIEQNAVWTPTSHNWSGEISCGLNFA